MDINELLKLNPNSECELKFTFTEEWKHCYYQLKNKSSPELDPNNLPVLDEEYSGDTGESLLNDNDEEVFDPTQEIKYELYYEIEQSDTYKSKTFIGLLQENIKDLINSGELSSDSEQYELMDALDIQFDPNYSAITFFEAINCDDSEHLENINEYDSLLWCTSSQLDEERISFSIREI